MPATLKAVDLAPVPDAACYTLAEILAADDLPTAYVPVPEWGGKHVKIGTLSAAERLAYIERATVGDGVGGTRIDTTLAQLYLVQAALIDPVLDLDAAKALFNKSAAAWQRIQTAVLRFNRLDAAGQADLERLFRADAEPAPAV